MKFLYKINSRYDGFTPSRIPERMNEQGCLVLGWKRYIDEIELGAECWVYFRGPHRFQDGVYAKGVVSDVNRKNARILLTVNEYCCDAPITDAPTTARVAEAVSAHYTQVFLWPEQWDHSPECNASTCKDRLCDRCETWQSLPLISNGAYQHPSRLSGNFDVFVPAFWILPPRSYILQQSVKLKTGLHTVTNMFGNFKLGETAYGYSFAYGMYEVLNRHDILDFDEIVPIPLSPDKADKGELHRTRLLGKEVSRLTNKPVRERLRLTSPISKRSMLSSGSTTKEFEDRYYDLLEVVGTSFSERILLIDDVATHGSTITQALRRLNEVGPDLSIVVATAGQMITRPNVADPRDFIE